MVTTVLVILFKNIAFIQDGLLVTGYLHLVGDKAPVFVTCEVLWIKLSTNSTFGVFQLQHSERKERAI